MLHVAAECMEMPCFILCFLYIGILRWPLNVIFKHNISNFDYIVEDQSFFILFYHIVKVIVDMSVLIISQDAFPTRCHPPL